MNSAKEVNSRGKRAKPPLNYKSNEKLVDLLFHYLRTTVNDDPVACLLNVPIPYPAEQSETVLVLKTTREDQLID